MTCGASFSFFGWTLHLWLSLFGVLTVAHGFKNVTPGKLGDLEVGAARQVLDVVTFEGCGVR